MTSLLTCMKKILHFTFFITDPSNVRTMTQWRHSVYIFTDSGFLFGVPSFFSVEDRMTSWWPSDNSWMFFYRAGFGPECRSWFCGWPQWRHSDAMTTQCMFLQESGFLSRSSAVPGSVDDSNDVMMTQWKQCMGFTQSGFLSGVPYLFFGCLFLDDPSDVTMSQ